jgi:hypothetical protein
MGENKVEETKYLFNKEPICPNCETEYRDAWELTFDGGGEGETEVECGSCEKPFTIARHISVSYSTYPATRI